MNESLESPFARLTVSAEHGGWGLVPAAAEYPLLENQLVTITYRHTAPGSFSKPGRRIDLPLRSPAGDARIITMLHGPAIQRAFTAGSDNLQVEFTFALPQGLPAMFWWLRLCNRGAQPLWIERIELLEASNRGMKAQGGLKQINPKTAVFFSNGWQSWSYSYAYLPGERFHRTRLGAIRTPTDFNPGTPAPFRRGFFGGDMFGVLGDRSTGKGIAAGFLSQRRHFGSLSAQLTTRTASLRLWANGDLTRLDPGAEMHTDRACIFFVNINDPDPLAAYLDAVGRECGVGPLPARSPTGWCSWYQYSAENLLQGTVTAEAVRRNLSAIAEMRADLPLDIIQIDDGFQTAVGDWLEFNPGFPDGVAGLASEISAAGFTPGLWLAPFIVHPKSEVARANPDWLIRRSSGRPANAGYLWSTFAHGLDPTHPGVLDYTRRVIRTAVDDWGFRYLKLDFLYAAALDGVRHDPTQTRAQALTAGLQAIRQAAGPHTTILGCGCPLGPAVGWVQAMRISADTARRWKPAFQGIEPFFADEPNFPSARNACHNSLTRADLHRRWWINDPDCLLVRPQTQLSLDEIQSIATVIALSGGSFLLSDDLPALAASAEGHTRLRLARSLLPAIGARPQIIDRFDGGMPGRVRLDLENSTGGWSLLALFNWEDHIQAIRPDFGRFGLDPAGCYWLRSFWDGALHLAAPGELENMRFSLPAHGVCLLAVRPCIEHAPQYLGGDLHISQGLETSGWEWDAKRRSLALLLERPGRITGGVDLALPLPPRRAALNRKSVAWTETAAGAYHFPVEFTGQGELIVEC